MLTKREEKFLTKYEKDLLGPKRKFIALYGLTWATIVMVLTAAASILLDNGSAFWSTGRTLSITILTWLIGGFVYGWLLRWLLWQDYQKIKTKQAAGQSDVSLR